MASGFGKVLKENGIKGRVWTWTSPTGFPPEEGTVPTEMQVVDTSPPFEVTPLGTDNLAYPLCFEDK